jgi:hypothetical protein
MNAIKSNYVASPYQKQYSQDAMKRKKREMFGLKVLYWITFAKDRTEFESKFKNPEDAVSQARSLY